MADSITLRSRRGRSRAGRTCAVRPDGDGAVEGPTLATSAAGVPALATHLGLASLVIGGTTIVVFLAGLSSWRSAAGLPARERSTVFR